MIHSQFGKKFSSSSSISLLMKDLNEGLRKPDVIMLGGGNPAHIPEMDQYFQQLLIEMAKNGQLNEALCNYDGPQGKDALLEALANTLNEQVGWNISAKNIALTNGSQSAFFYLFNILAGCCEQGIKRKVLFPLTPEYVGYADTGLDDDIFVANKPLIDILPNGQFKYRINFESLKITDDIGVICVSRPTNPTGNVITDAEIMQLDALAKQYAIPLLIDSAYGIPFPGIIFNQATPIWNENIILSMSLSKLGLPGCRCGIIIANESIINAISNMNGIISLSPGSIGPALMLAILKRNDLLKLSQTVIKPFYQQRVTETVKIIRRYIPESRCLIHKPEGAIFLWLWFKDLPIDSQTLYTRLKKRGVLMVPGDYFFPGLNEHWHHSHQCMRMNYILPLEKIEQGIAILADEIEIAYQ
ncbi:valine--pyruvate transaminase [Candidatus Arsenophonus nilaparvatae]|uniref:valine--pyruvate transaminase n=1 Tax=Candidatus Arsenophonus nilaparvatae TaxID=1247023 RepID=UPI000509E45D|nr:valine--pyruvate transaminase [Candidatus Arsenophonus nilaparvatae]